MLEHALISAIFPILGLMRKELLPSCQRSRFLMSKDLWVLTCLSHLEVVNPWPEHLNHKTL